MKLFELSGVPTDQGGAASWPYAATGGRLPVRPQDMPQAREAAWRAAALPARDAC